MKQKDYIYAVLLLMAISIRTTLNAQTTKYLRVFISLLTGILFSFPVSVHGQCLNLDFSMADFTYWQPYTGTWSWSSWSGETVNISTSLPTIDRHTIIDAGTLTALNMMDNRCLSIPKVPPGFDYSAKLGNSSVNSQMEALEYTMTVDSTNSLLILHFAWIMEDPGHWPEEQPRFSMKIRDTLGNLLTGVGCVDVNFIAAQNLSNLACKTPSLVARNWTTVGFSLEAMIGQTIKIYFETRDCSQGGHYGYAYMVGECRPMAIGVMYCDGQDTAYLSAPDGFVKYKWTRTSNPGWEIEGVDSVCQDIVIDDPIDGEEFICELSSEVGLDCAAVLHAIVARTSVKADFLYGIMENGGVDIVGHDSVSWYDTCPRTATFVNLSSIKNSKTGYILWEIPDLSVVSTDSLFTYTFPPTDTIVDYLVRLTVVTGNGCEDMKERYIRIYPLPFVDDSVNDILVCAGTNQTFNLTGTNINPDSSVWTNSNPAIGLGLSGRGNISFTATNTGTVPLGATIIMTSKSNHGCIGNNKAITITVNPLPVVDDVDDISVCTGINQTVNFTGTNINIDSCVWTNNNPTIGLDTSGRGNISFMATNTGITPLTGTIAMTTKSDNGCIIAQKSFTITVHPLPVMDNVENISVCLRTSQTINFTGILMNADSSMWTNSDSAIGLSENGTGNISFITSNTRTTPLTSTITVIPNSNEGCIGYPKTFTITVYPETYIHAAANDSLFCEGANVVFEVTNLHELNNIQWTGVDGFSSSLPNPDIQNLSLNNAGIYIVTAMTQDNCEAVPDSLFIAVLPDIVLDMEDTVFICNSGAVIHSNASNATQYLWNTGKRTDSIKVSSAGEYWVMASNQRCQASDTTYVVEIEIPDFEIDTIGELCQDGSMELYVDLDMENLSYRWTTGDTTDRIIISQNGVYGITVSYSGCTVLQNFTAECPCGFWIPNTFTPNGDGNNEVFIPVPKSELNSFSMNIYDRWGNLIFHTDTLKPWDGTNNGNYAKTDVYTYVINYSCLSSPNKKRREQGEITLLR
jgi:gliding motility-associated-like protein